MNSSPKVYSRSSNVQVKAWSASKLDVDLDIVSNDASQKDQLLALFRTDEETASRGRENGSRSNLHPAGTDLLLTTWLPGEMEIQSSAEDAEEWIFVEAPGELFSGAPREVRKQQPVHEKENVKILEQAHTQAEEILAEARSAAEKLIQQAHAEIDQAKKDGHQQGLNDARSEMQETLKAVHAMVEETREWQSTLLKQGEQFLTEMLKEIAQTMFGEGVNLDANALQLNLNRIMEHAQRLGDLNILLNPHDAHLLDTSWSEYQLLITGNKVRIIPSEKILPGGCIVKGSMGMVDGRVETQLAAVLNSLDETRDSNG